MGYLPCADGTPAVYPNRCPHNAAMQRVALILSHSIVHDGRTVYQGPSETYPVPNGRRATVKKTLRAATRPGAFTVEVALGYQSAQDGGVAAFQIR